VSDDTAVRTMIWCRRPHSSANNKH
jgi:hypothetical protein